MKRKPSNEYLSARPRLFVILCFVGFLISFLNGMTNPIMPLFAQSLGASGALIGMVVSSFYMLRIVFEIPSGYVSDKIGRRAPIILGLLFTIITMILCGFVLDSYQLILTRAFLGVGASFFFCTTSALMIDIFDTQARGRAFGILIGIEQGGLLFGSLGGGYLASLFNYRMVFLIGGLILIPALILSFVSKELKALGPAERLLSQNVGTYSSIKFLMSRRLVFLCCIAFFICFIYQGIILTVFPSYAFNSLNIDVAMIGVLMSMSGVGLFLSPFIVGFISEKVGRKRLLLIGISCLSLFMYLFSFAKSWESFLPLMLISGFAKGSLMALGPILAVEAIDFSARGTSIGAYRTSFDLGNVAGPVVMAMIASSSSISVFHFAAFLALITIIPVLLLEH